MAELILAADIGGTNSRFAVFEIEPGGRPALREKIWLKTSSARSFSELIEQLVSGSLGHILTQTRAAALAIAGPVEHGRYCNPPNIPWDVDLDRDGELLPKKTSLINDFTAQAFACVSPIIAEARLLLPGRPHADATLACIGAGTGLGKCSLVQDGHGGHVAVPSEGGHALFPLVNAEELAFGDFILQQTGRDQVIGDVVVSGPGLRLLHRHLTGQDLEPREIMNRAGPESRTVEWFARFYGRACRQYALEVLSLAGLFISCGLAAKSTILVEHPAFALEFHASQTHGRLLRDIPVRLNANEDSGLWGAAVRAVEMVRIGVKGG